MKCKLCSAELSQDRIEALQVLETNPLFYYCIGCANHQIGKVKGIFFGYSGISPLVRCDGVGNQDGISNSFPVEDHDSETE